MEEAKKLKEEYDQKLKELQDGCPHTESQWLPYMWAPGHFFGEHKCCPNCWKVLDKR